MPKGTKRAAKPAGAKSDPRNSGVDKEIKNVAGAGSSVDGAQQRVEDANAKMVWGDVEPDAAAPDAKADEPETAKAQTVPGLKGLEPRPDEPQKYDPKENADIRTADNWDFEKGEPKGRGAK